MQVYQNRQHLRQMVRRFFDDRGFLEVATPVLVPQPGVEVHTTYFETRWRSVAGVEQPLFLRSSPELAMKGLLSQGCRKIYQLGPCFRSGGEFTAWHHPEFEMLEWYEAAIDLPGLINQTCDLVKEVAASSLAKITLPQAPVVLTVAEAFATFAGIELVDGDPELGAKGQARGWHSPRVTDDFETAYFKIMLEVIEPECTRLGWVCLRDYPASQAILARVVGGVAQRFEMYLNGIELCNGFDELTDATEARQRLAAVNRERLAGGQPPLVADEGFYQAMANGMPACSGNALGLDRLAAIMAGHQGLAAAMGMGRGWYGPPS